MNGLDATVIIRRRMKLPSSCRPLTPLFFIFIFILERGSLLGTYFKDTLSALRTCLSRYLPKLVW